MRPDPRLPGRCIRCGEFTYVAMWTGPPDDPEARRVSVCPECHDHLRRHPEEIRRLIALAP
jgi:hypothetical protein